MKTTFRDQRQAMDILNTYCAVLDGNVHTIELLPFKRKQTAEQQAKFHVLCREFAKVLKHEHGVDTSEEGVKQYMKDEFGPTERYITPDGRGRARPKSSAKWTLMETSEMIDHLLRVAAEHEVILE